MSVVMRELGRAARSPRRGHGGPWRFSPSHFGAHAGLPPSWMATQEGEKPRETIRGVLLLRQPETKDHEVRRVLEGGVVLQHKT